MKVEEYESDGFRKKDALGVVTICGGVEIRKGHNDSSTKEHVKFNWPNGLVRRGFITTILRKFLK